MRPFKRGMQLSRDFLVPTDMQMPAIGEAVQLYWDQYSWLHKIGVGIVGQEVRSHETHDEDDNPVTLLQVTSNVVVYKT